MLKTSRPPEDAVELESWVLRAGGELSGLRAALFEIIAGRPQGKGEHLDDIPESMVLVATELATNALRHGLPPTKVRLLKTGDQYVLDVADHDPDSAPAVEDDRPLSGGGRGLQLAQSFSLEVGWYTSEDAKHVWATFPVHAS